MWILPAIIKSCSRIYPENWDQVSATTNGGEGQHCWGDYSVISFQPWNTFYKVDVRNFRAREEVDWRTANEIWDFKQHGTLVNLRNDIFNHMSRNTQHISTSPQKFIAAKRHEAQMSKIHERITNEKALCKQSMLWWKELQVELGSTTSSTAWGFRATAQSLPLLQGSSSGLLTIYITTLF